MRTLTFKNRLCSKVDCFATLAITKIQGCHCEGAQRPRQSTQDCIPSGSNRQSCSFLSISFWLMLCLIPVGAQESANYDEALVPEYTLPSLLTANDQSEINTAALWQQKRRPEILELFAREMFGRIPQAEVNVSFTVYDHDPKALAGLATRKQVRILITNRQDSLTMDLLLYLPNGSKKSVPVFLGLNFLGNHTLDPDTNITIRNQDKAGGERVNRWPVKDILAAGYGVASIWYEDIDPDFDDGFQNGIHPLFYREGQTQPSADEWGSIAAWAWGLSRAMDYLQQDKDVDGNRIIVLGHSRLGKTALWAGALDERFALVISNNSGCGGAALSHRHFGETVARINTVFPHWFCTNYKKYNNNEANMPFDQHMLIALIAPRPVYVASALEDQWADPRGEFLSAKHAAVVYRLFGEQPVIGDMPEVDHPVIYGKIGYHIRSGKHDVTPYDWQQYITFADLNLK
jgi:hypothetical protein